MTTVRALGSRERHRSGSGPSTPMLRARRAYRSPSRSDGGSPAIALLHGGTEHDAIGVHERQIRHLSELSPAGEGARNAAARVRLVRTGRGLKDHCGLACENLEQAHLLVAKSTGSRLSTERHLRVAGPSAGDASSLRLSSRPPEMDPAAYPSSSTRVGSVRQPRYAGNGTRARPVRESRSPLCVMSDVYDLRYRPGSPW